MFLNSYIKNTCILQHSYTGSTSLGYSQIGVLTEMSEAEVLNSMMRSHDSMMAVLKNRHRSLQIIYSFWHNKDLKVVIYLIPETWEIQLDEKYNVMS